jgi:ABC-2 type transport system permease protein
MNWGLTMNKSGIVARRELGSTLGRTSFRLMTALIPVLGLVAVIGFLVFQAVRSEGAPEEKTIGYVDATSSFDGAFEQGLVTFKPYGDEAAAIGALLDDEIDQLYVIPVNYLETGVVLEVKREERGLSIDTSSTTTLRRFLVDNLLEGAVSEYQIERVRQPVVLATLEVDESGAPVKDDPLNVAHLAFFLGLGVLIVISIMTSAGYILQGLNEEKENRIMEVLLSSVSPSQLMLGKLLGLGAAGLIQVVLWAISGVALLLLLGSGDIDLPELTLPPPVPLLLGLAYFFLGYALFGTLMAALGAITTSQRESSQISFIVIFPAVAPTWFITPMLTNPDSTLATVLTLIPFTAPVTALFRIALGAIGPLELALSMALMLGTIFLTVLLTQRLFRVYLLMYGRRPGIREMGRTLMSGR